MKKDGRRSRADSVADKRKAIARFLQCGSMRQVNRELGVAADALSDWLKLDEHQPFIASMSRELETTAVHTARAVVIQTLTRLLERALKDTTTTKDLLGIFALTSDRLAKWTATKDDRPIPATQLLELQQQLEAYEREQQQQPKIVSPLSALPVAGATQPIGCLPPDTPTRDGE